MPAEYGRLYPRLVALSPQIGSACGYVECLRLSASDRLFFPTSLLEKTWACATAALHMTATRKKALHSFRCMAAASLHKVRERHYITQLPRINPSTWNGQATIGTMIWKRTTASLSPMGAIPPSASTALVPWAACAVQFSIT